MSKYVVDRDLGWNRIKREAKKKTNSVFIGIRGGNIGKTNLATIGLYHEKGGKNNRPPKRSFIQPTVDANFGKYMRLLNKIADNIFTGKSSKEESIFTLWAVVNKQIKARISSGILPQIATSQNPQNAR